MTIEMMTRLTRRTTRALARLGLRRLTQHRHGGVFVFDDTLLLFWAAAWDRAWAVHYGMEVRP